MSTRNNIIDATGSNYGAKVDKYNTLWVRDLGIPPTSDPDGTGGSALALGEVQTAYREYLTLNGDGVTFDARVTGTLASPVSFFVAAEQGFDIYITSLAIVAAGGGLTLARFGGGTALTNGLKFYYQSANGNIIIGNDIKSSFDVVRLCQGNPAFTDASSGAFIASNVIGASEALLQVLDFRKTFGLPYGIRLNTSSVNKIVMEVRDAILTTGPTTTTQFDVIAYGTRIKI
jgi:hypothetical protein